jgi:hypothetical protein
MKKKIFLSLVIVILLSLFFLMAKYQEKVADATITHQQYLLLETLDIFTNTDERLAQLFTENPQAWLNLAQYYANSNANIAYQLGEYFLNREELNSATLWYQDAIRQQHIGARIALATLYFKRQQYSEINAILLPVVSNESALALLYKVALYQGNLSFIQQYESALSQSTNADFYHELVQFSVFNTHHVKALTLPTTAKTSSCPLNVQLFATNLAGLRHAQQLMLEFSAQGLAKYICLHTPKYVSLQALNCQHSITEKISCNAIVWTSRKDIFSRYLGVVVEQGGANVDNGIMYLDQQDNVNVLVHELSHFIGFVDEYPLPKQHQKCQQNQLMPFAHNLVVLPEYYQGERAELREKILSQVPWRSLVKDSVPILSKVQQGWKLVTPIEYQGEVGVFAAASCNNQSKIQAYKPLAQRTKLQYFELLFPKTYIDILNIAPSLFLMPSYHFNMSRALVEQGDYGMAREVLKATVFE